MQHLVGEPWIRYRDTTLYAVPSIHNRLIFAQLVVEACRRRRFDVIAVELPESLDRDWLRRLADFAPATGVLVDAYGPQMPLWVTNAEDVRPRRVAARRGMVIPITPADSIITALRCPQLLATHWPEWHPHVVAIDTTHSPRRRPPIRTRIVDDYEIMVRGMAAFQQRWTDAWQSGRVDPLDGRRERLMACHLARFIDEGRQILFVCGAAHWHPITTLLDSGLSRLVIDPTSAACHVQTGGLHVVPIDPSGAWLSGWLDDIPSVVWDYECACRGGTVTSWDKREAIHRLMAAALEQEERDHHGVSPRLLARMMRYQEVLLAAAGRWTPELDDHLTHSAETCISRGFGRRLKELALGYPPDSSELGESAHLIKTKNGRTVLRVGEDHFLFERPDPEVGGGRRRPLPATRLTTSERGALRRTDWVYRDWPSEQALHNRLIDHARRLAHDAPQAEVVKPFTVGLARGIALRHTLNARAKGLPDVFVRYPKTHRQRQVVCDGLCPVVWIFDAVSPVRSTFAGYVPRQAHSHSGQCYSAFYWLKDKRTLGDSQIQQLSVAFTVSLMRGLMPIRERRGASTVSAVVASFPSHRRATIAPWDDASLSMFRGCDLAVACAVQYAGDHVIVVSRKSHPIASSVGAFARQRSVRLIALSEDRFSTQALERLALDHNVPAPSHWSPPFGWCTRFIPGIDEF